MLEIFLKKLIFYFRKNPYIKRFFKKYLMKTLMGMTPLRFLYSRYVVEYSAPSSSLYNIVDSHDSERRLSTKAVFIYQRFIDEINSD